MKKAKKSKALKTRRIKNPVAKFAGQFNKAQVFKDKTKYQRNAKHKGQEPFAMMRFSLLQKVSACVARRLSECNEKS
ncbi:MAG: hypothetical protein L3J75_17075 [Methylococcaceae bacterium]|nr:hypothetical protein [Methylococcaceae bacterium]